MLVIRNITNLPTCQPANLPTFGGTVPLFELCKVKKRDSPTFLKFQWWRISLYEQQRMMSILHGIFTCFTSAFSLVYIVINLAMKTLPEPQLRRFFWFLAMHMHTVLAQCPTYFTLVGWQVYNNFVSNLWQQIFYMSLLEVKWTIPHVGQNRVKNTTVHSGSMLVFNSSAVSSKLSNALFWQVIKISLNKMWYCIEVRWTIPHMLLQEVVAASLMKNNIFI